MSHQPCDASTSLMETRCVGNCTGHQEQCTEYIVYLQWARELGQRIGHGQHVRVPLHACEHNVLFSKPVPGVTSNMPGINKAFIACS